MALEARRRLCQVSMKASDKISWIERERGKRLTWDNVDEDSSNKMLIDPAQSVESYFMTYKKKPCCCRDSRSLLQYRVCHVNC
jgi:hypothetical protein